MPRRETHKDLEVFQFRDYKAWLAWLAKNHKQSESIWLKFAKKDSGIRSVTYEEAREGAITYGWIDGLINRYDESYYLIKFTPRRPKSKWSKINREIAEGLIKRKKMKPSGLEQVKAAKKDGRWATAYDSASTIKVPPALQKLIDSNKTAKKNFESLSSANRYAFLYRIHNSKRDETKKRHIEKAFEMLKKGEVYHPQQNKPKKAVKKKRIQKKK